MSSEYEPQFITNNYTIQINILYNAKDIKDDDAKDDDANNSDNMNNSYYIINNMKDILLKEFSNEEHYNLFKNKYNANDANDAGNPLYMINSSFYIDTNVMETIRKVTSPKFPSFARTKPVQKEEFKNNFTKFNSNSTISLKYKESLNTTFKDTLIRLIIDDNRRKPNAASETIIKDIKDTRSLEELFANTNFIDNDLTISPGFHTIIKNIYDNAQNNTLKLALQLFYDIPNSTLSNKSKYEYFLNTDTITNIIKVIDDYSNNDDSLFGSRRSSLNDNRTKEEIYNKYFKYVFPDKENIASLSDPDKDTILMFYNVYYIIKNIYLLDNTIINVTNYKIKKNKEQKKYYISQVSLLDLKDNVTNFIIEKKKVIIYVKATLKLIIENPTLQINYLIDDLENVRQNFLPQSYILKPKDINNNYSSYDKIYIHNKFKYIDNIKNIDEIVKVSLKKNYIKNKEELFLNTKALKLLNNFIKAKQGKTIKPQDEIKIIELNIKYLLHKLFKFYNNKEFKKYYIADTYIQYFNQTSTYYSITKGDIIEKNEKYEIISNLFTESSVSDEELSTSGDITKSRRLFKEIKSSDARLNNNKIYKINVVFRCYFDKTGMKPTFVRKIVAEKCLSRAQKLDEAFTNSLYKTFNLPENYLYNKLANITRKQKPTVMPENKINQVAPQQNIPLKKGGKLTKKYNHNKNRDNIIFTNNNIYQ
jgi:hypothetical protein